MSNLIKHKKSGVAGKKPQLSDLDAAELLFNYKDGVFYGKKISVGIETVVEFHGSETPHLFKNVVTPASPGSGYSMLYAKADNNFYALNSSGVESMLLTGTKVDSFNGRSGVVLLTKADVEGVLTGVITSHSHNYDNYQNWNLKTGGVQRLVVGSGTSVDFVGSGATSVGYSNGVVTISSTNTDTNNYPTGLNFSTSTGILTLSRNGLTALTIDLDGRYLVTKADVEGVLTGVISSHTHAYDNYESWSCSADGTGTELIVSGKRVNFIGDGNGITVNSYDVSGTHTMRINNTKPFPGFGTIAGVAAEGNHTHIGYASSTHTHTLASLSDTTITSVASGEILKWNGSAWINNTLAEAGIQAVGAMSLASLSDTTITSVATGEVLKWSGTKWINNTLAEAGIAAASHTHNYDNYGSWQAQAGGNTLDISSSSWLNFVGGTGISLAFDTTYHKITITNTGTTPTTVVTTATSTATSAASVNISGLSVALISGKVYEFEAVLNIGVSAAAGGSNFGINYSSGTTAYVVIGTGSSSQATSWRMTSLTNLVGGFLLAASDSGMVMLKGIIKPTASSNLTIKHQKTGSGSSYVYANSYLKVTEIS